MVDKYYKVIKNNKSFHGGCFDWTPYLPKEDCPGEWPPEIDNISECHRGYHITKYWNMWYEDGSDIYEVELLGVLENNEIGVAQKHVAKSIRLVRQLKPDFKDHSNTGNWNTGYRNTGYFNTTTPETINIFNKPCLFSVWENAEKPSFLYFNLDDKLGFKGSFQKSFEGATEKDIELLKKLPNFDKDVFFEISGIDVDCQVDKS